MFIKSRITLQIGTTATTGPGIGSTDAARSFPLSTVASNIILTINGTQFNLPSRDVLKALLWIDNENLSAHNDMTPSMLDDSQQYADFVLSNRNVLGGLWAGGSGSSSQVPRGAFNYTEGASIQVGATGVYNTSVSFDIFEPVLISPLAFQRDTAGLIGVQQIGLTYNIGDIRRLWSSAVATTTVGAVPGQSIFSSDTALIIEYLTPSDAMDLPKQLTMPYTEVMPFVSNSITNIAAGAAATLQGPSIQLPCIPSHVLIYARRQNTDETHLTPDAFLSTTQLGITWGNQTGILQTATPQHLYKMSKANGVSQSWQSWSGRGYASAVNGAAVGMAGSVCVLKFGKDIPLATSEAPGQPGSWQFSAQGTFTNTAGTGVNAVLYCVFLTEGAVYISDGRCTTEIGVLTAADVLDAKLSEPVSSATIDVLGGSVADMYGSLSAKIRAALPHHFKKAVGGSLLSKTRAVDDPVWGGQHMSRGKLSARLR
jgi:hypothetical protein